MDYTYNVNIIEITIDNRNELPLQIVEMLSKDDVELQRKIEKAKKYSLELDRFKVFDDKIIVHSMHGNRTVKIDDDKYSCDCDFYQENNTCSHIMAVINSNIKEVK